MKQVLSLAVLIMALSGVNAHVYLADPPARNFLHNTDYCPHCLNAGGVKITGDSGKRIWPDSRYSICGDVHTGPFNHIIGGQNAPSGSIAKYYHEGQDIVTKLYVNAFHKGRVGLRICKVSTDPDAEKAALTDGCLESNVLVQSNHPSAQKPGERWFYLGLKKLTHYTFTMYYKLPAGLTCRSTEGTKCVLQMYYLTGNNCQPPGSPPEYSTRGLPTCGTPGSLYPEEFWNCIDIEIHPQGSTLPTSPPVPPIK